jgi:methylphosphotriester-DNA--protein-cysteine methyltransferase
MDEFKKIVEHLEEHDSQPTPETFLEAMKMHMDTFREDFLKRLEKIQMKNKFANHLTRLVKQLLAAGDRLTVKAILTLGFRFVFKTIYITVFVIRGRHFEAQESV